MISDITQFLPIYTDITKDDFYMDIFKKKEFYDERLEEMEEIQNSGDLLKAQIIISRFLSSYTPYNTLLLNHAVGTGKTCAAIGSIEKIKSENNSFTGALIFARGDTLLENFKNEIIFQCTPGQYIPEGYFDLTHGQQVARKNKSVGRYYQFYTFETFAKEIRSFSDTYIIENYSNKIIVIDEVHNIRLQDLKKKTTIKIYDNFHRFLHIVKNCKILLMSGTPIKDSIDEISSVMNLILPENKQLPTGNLFISQFFDYKDDDYTVKTNKLQELKDVFKGRVSYLDAIRSEVKQEYEGETIGNLKYFKVYKDIMSDFQTKVYTGAYIKDHKKKDKKKKKEDEEIDEEEGEEDGAVCKKKVLVICSSESGRDFNMKKNKEMVTEILGKNIDYSYLTGKLGSIFPQDMKYDSYDLIWFSGCNVLGWLFSSEDLAFNKSNILRLQNNLKNSGYIIFTESEGFIRKVNNPKSYGLTLTLENIDAINNIMYTQSFEHINIPLLIDFWNEIFDNEEYKGKYIVYTKKIKDLYEKDETIEESYLRKEGESDNDIPMMVLTEDYPFDKKFDGVGLEIDNTGGRFDTNSRQASLFVFPDGSYGKNGFKNPDYVKSSVKKNIFSDATVKANDFSIGPGLKKVLYTSDYEDMLENLRMYSSKYAEVIRKLLDAYENGKSSFVYCEYVEGSGGILFSLILELFGFKKYSGSENLKKPINEGKRYSIINNRTTYPNEIKNIIERFNEPKNMNGKFISVIIGSKVIAEGITLKNIQEEHILTPHWNYSETSQAIARGYRFKSHKDLIRAGLKPELKVYQYVSIPNNDTPSIDLRLYEISEIKDRNIGGITQIIKESAFDCALNYKRNHITGYDYQRECNYTTCDYTCEGIPSVYYMEDKKPILDYSSYQIYYNTPIIDEIILKIREIFREVFKIKLQIVFSMFKDVYTKFDILTTIRTIINDNIQINNKYGINSYLREENDILFLVDSITNENNYFSNYYNKNPILEVTTSYIGILTSIYKKELPILIEKLFSSTDENEIVDLLLTFPLDLKEIILESSLIAKEKELEESVFQREKILEYFKYSYEKIDDILVSSLMYREKRILRCFDVTQINILPIDELWENCGEDIVGKFVIGKKEKINTLKQNEYFGKFDDKKFRIVKSNFTEDRRNENTGKVCDTWPKPIVVYIMTNSLKIPLTILDDISRFLSADPSNVPDIIRKSLPNTQELAKYFSKLETVKKDFKKIKDSKDRLISELLIKNNYANVCTYNDTESPPVWELRKYEHEELDEFSYDELKAMYFFCKLTLEQNCKLVKLWFAIQDPPLLFYDEGLAKA